MIQILQDLSHFLSKGNVKNTLGMGQQLAIPLNVPGFDAGNFLQGFFQRTAIVEAVAIRKIKLIPRLERHHANMVTEFFVKQGKQLIEQKRCSNHRRPRIVAKTVTLEYLSTSTQLGAAVKNRNRITLGSQAERSRDSAKARADNNGVRRCALGRDEQTQGFFPVNCE